MLKIYLDWNIITHLKDEQNSDLFTFLQTNKDYFIFPYSKAHIKDLLVVKMLTIIIMNKIFNY